MHLKIQQKHILLLLFFFIFSIDAAAQSEVHRKGNLYAYWGYNRGWFSNSNIHFWGSNYDFTLDNVIAKDRQSEFDVNVYFNPTKISIPQFNFRIGYAFNDHWDISIALDHMKYVVQEGQVVKINGEISKTQTSYDNVYDDSEIQLDPEFMHFEHTDGLNYENIELRRYDELMSFGKISLNMTEGIGAGFLLPKTNTTLWTNDRNDEFHLAGYGLAGVVAANVTFYNHFFIQTEFKTGFIHMPDIRTTKFKEDRASQHFFFTQWNFVFGYQFNLIPKNQSKSSR